MGGLHYGAREASFEAKGPEENLTGIRGGGGVLGGGGRRIGNCADREWTAARHRTGYRNHTRRGGNLRRQLGDVLCLRQGKSPGLRQGRHPARRRETCTAQRLRRLRLQRLRGTSLERLRRLRLQRLRGTSLERLRRLRLRGTSLEGLQGLRRLRLQRLRSASLERLRRLRRLWRRLRTLLDMVGLGLDPCLLTENERPVGGPCRTRALSDCVDIGKSSWPSLVRFDLTGCVLSAALPTRCSVRPEQGGRVGGQPHREALNQ
jgi:hypothetical protein